MMQIREEYFQKLEVWRLSYELATEVYRATATFPREERFGLAQQLRRAAVSIVTNLAEGHARGTTREYLRFCLISRGSQTEIHALLLLSRDLGFLTESKWSELTLGYVRIGKMLNKLIDKLRKGSAPGLGPRPPASSSTTLPGA